MNQYIIISISILSACCLSAQASDPTLDPDYAACIRAIEENPKAGRMAALRWITDGGGDPAKHCAAIGDIAIGRPLMAAGRLQEIAQTTRSKDPYLAATLYVQASEAWITGGKEKEALITIEEAYKMAPNDINVDLKAAPIYAEAGRWGLVKKTLESVERRTELNADALILLGRAKKELSDFEGAAKDVRRALNLDPENIDGLILRGEIVQVGYAITPYGVD